MKRITCTRVFLTTMLCGVVGVVTAQFTGTRSQFLMSSLLENPAAAGSNPCLDMRMGVRAQWAGFDGAPLSSFASLSGRIGESTTFSHGIGGYVITDEIGPWSNTRFNLAYSTKVRLTNGAKLSAGIAAGMVQYRLDVGSLQFPVFSASEDPALFDNATSQTVFPSMDLGLWYENDKTFLAFSVLNAMATTLSDIGMTTSSGRTMVLMGGKYIQLDRRFAFRPAGLMRLASGLPASLDLQGSFSLDDKVSLGLGYRSGSALTGIMSLKIFDSMTVGYSYDFGVNDLSVIGRSSHEIVISLTACDKNDPYVGPNGRCPAYD